MSKDESLDSPSVTTNTGHCDIICSFCARETALTETKTPSHIIASSSVSSALTVRWVGCGMAGKPTDDMGDAGRL